MSKSPAKVRPRLGRGLSSLISVSDLPVEVELVPPLPSEPPTVPALDPIHESAGALAGASIDIRITDIVPNPHQPRKSWDEPALAELAASIRSTGLIQPIILRKVHDGYQIIAGERRWRAAKLAGLTSLPAIIRDVDGFTQAQMALVENIQRQDLNPIDRASGYLTLIDQLGLTQGELAARLGEDRSSIANFLRLLDLIEPVRAMVEDGRLSMGHAKLLAGMPDAVEQTRLAELTLSQGLSVRNLERLVQAPQKEPTPSRSPVHPSAHLQDLEKTLSRQLGMRVQVRSTGKQGRGKLIVQYGSLDQFDKLLARLGVSAE